MANSFIPTGYWSYNNCDYNADMIYFTDDGFIEIRLKEKKLFPNTRPKKYIMNGNSLVHNKSVFKIIDSRNLINQDSKELVKCDISTSKKNLSKRYENLSIRPEIILLCSGHNTAHRCKFKIQKIGSKIEATLSQDCKWGFFDENTKNRKKGTKVVFEDENHLQTYAETICN